MEYVTTEETKVLYRRVVKLAYFYAKQALIKIEDTEEAQEAFRLTSEIEKELKKDIKYETHMQKSTYNIIMNIFDEIQKYTDENGYFSIPYEMPYAINAVWNCL